MEWQVLALEFMPTSKLFLTRSDLENVRKWEYKVSALRLRLQRFPTPRAAHSTSSAAAMNHLVSGQRQISDDAFVGPVLELARKLHPCKCRTQRYHPRWIHLSATRVLGERPQCCSMDR
jgi:hypothetical protein